MQTRFFACIAVCLIFSFSVDATRLQKVSILDKDFLMISFVDGDVEYFDDGLGKGAFETENDAQNNIVISYGLPLDIEKAVDPQNWIIVSDDDPAFGKSGLNPIQCFRKSKISGMAQLEWKGNDYHYEAPMRHTIYLKLPVSLRQGKKYRIHINSNTNTHLNEESFTFDIYSHVSEAVHVNLAGYMTGHEKKSCDLYAWLGDGEGRDYSSFEGNTVWLYNVTTGESSDAGKVVFWKNAATEQKYYDQTGTRVWNADINGRFIPGIYRIVIEGVGCSQDFAVDDHLYVGPFSVSVKGFFYMRIGQDNPEMTPVPRRPLYIPGVSPGNTTVIITTMHPYHPQWNTFSSGDVWDRPDHWVAYTKPGNRTNNQAFGGHSDALDWDRHLGHVSIIYDMLLPFILTKGAITDDNLGIAESGNSIPDILDEARNEVDFWLRLRDGIGYSHGVTNPDRQNRLFQAENTAIAAWANAANCAMLSDCFRLAGMNTLMETYRDSALTAYRYAGGLADPMMDQSQNVGDISLTGREFKLIAAAFLYNVTGVTEFEKELFKYSNIKNEHSVVLGKHVNEIWSSAAYLMTPQEVHFPDFYKQIKMSVIQEALSNEAGYCSIRPSRRGTDEATGYFKTEQNMHRTMIAHAVTSDSAQRKLFENAMILEADWGLGRNPLNMIQMTTATTLLEGKRSVEYAYTAGRDDGTPGMHPGHTPYLNTDDWGKGMIMSRPSWMTSQCYPEYAKWPKSEGYFKTPYVWAHSEFTPQQTMRGKTALYGYLYGISK